MNFVLKLLFLNFGNIKINFLKLKHLEQIYISIKGTSITYQVQLMVAKKLIAEVFNSKRKFV